ncbi:MAG: MvaI/BcnI restriction endonuclease family protein [Sedimentisphaerales bacterium]|nr:MvaI/BcnI restriction endonuclease family protein [Sedimentisphaerales bacterium]
MKIFSKQELIDAIREIAENGWHKSIKNTINQRNDGAVGNTLEKLLGIEENNLPIPNAAEWELKGQRKKTSSLITFKHTEPSPRALKFVPQILLPKYGWKHKEAGKKYPISEMSFRSTTYGTRYSKRGFRINIDRSERKIRFVFKYNEADISKPEIATWLKQVEERIGLGDLNPEPYWGFDDLRNVIGQKMKNCFYVVADSKIENKHEFFKYIELYLLSGFSFDRFIDAIEDGFVLVDFDARTGHNHGTKFRLKQGYFSKVYTSMERIFY